MNHLDLINGVFECGGAILTWLNVLRLRRDKEVKGVDWRVTGFWSAWGLSNLYYYFSLGHWISLAGGVVLVAANITWVAHAIYYARHPRPTDDQLRDLIEAHTAAHVALDKRP